MNLQKKLIQLSEYKCSFKYVESYFLISMTYPQSWSIIPSEDRTIEVAEEDGVTFYAAPIETDIDKAFELIDETIAYNLDVEKKMNLLKFNINKLQEMFATKSLEELETIEFVTIPVTPKKEKKLAKPKKTTRKVVKKTTQKKKEKKTEEITEERSIVKGDILIDTPNWGGIDECSDETNYDDFELNATVDPNQSENKYLEVVDR